MARSVISQPEAHRLKRRCVVLERRDEERQRIYIRLALTLLRMGRLKDELRRALRKAGK